MTNFNWSVIGDKELSALIRNGGVTAGYDTEFNHALVEESARRIEVRYADIAAAVQAERERIIASGNKFWQGSDSAAKWQRFIGEITK